MAVVDKIEFDIVGEIGGIKTALARVEAEAKNTARRMEAEFSRGGNEAARGIERNITDGLRRIEGSVRSSGATFGTLFGAGFASNFAAKFIQDGVRAVKEHISNLYNEIQNTAKLSKLTGASTDDIQRLRFAGAIEGVNEKDFKSGVEDLVIKLNEARREENELSKLLDANNVKWKANKDEVIGINEALRAAASLMQNAATEADKIEIAKILGLSRDWIDVLEKGPDALKKAMDAATETGGIIDKELVKKADDFDKAWKEASANIGMYIKAGIMTGGAAIGELFTSIDAWLTSKTADLARWTRSNPVLANLLNLPGREAPGEGGVPVDQSRPPLEVTIRKGRKTVIPKKKEGGGSGSDEDDESRAERVNALLDARLAKLTLNNAKLLEAEIAEQQILYLKQAGLEADDEEGIKLKEKVANLVRATKAFEELKRQAEAFTDSLKQIGSTLVDALGDFIFRGESAIDIAKRLVEWLGRAAMQSALLGQGPLAGIFGTTSKDGAGGVLGLVVNALKGFAPGGGSVGPPLNILPASATGNAFGAGDWSMVGERGPELVRFNRDARVYPAEASRQMMRGGSGGGDVPVTVNFAVSSPDAPSFKAAQGQIEVALARAVSRARRGL